MKQNAHPAIKQQLYPSNPLPANQFTAKRAMLNAQQTDP